MTESRVAVLGTLSDLHRQSIAYDLKVLARLIKEIQPDLLCAEIRRDHWETGDVARMPVEYREALLPVCKRSDIVLVPIAGTQGESPVESRGLRAALVGVLNWQLRLMQRLAGTPEAINSGAFGVMCSWMCGLIAWAGGPEARRAWAAANGRILQNVLDAVRRDPGRRVLVTVDCRRRHLLDRRLRAFGEIEVVEFHQL
ncbi:MAG TPA: hypothetical protein VJ793_09800 [Anaerolineae bacterium]|nr:hypothetical protein [Anaerolineae bacterium]